MAHLAIFRSNLFLQILKSNPLAYEIETRGWIWYDARYKDTCKYSFKMTDNIQCLPHVPYIKLSGILALIHLV